MPVEQHSDPIEEHPFEERLSTALHQVGGTFHGDRAALSAAGAAHGRRLRIRRRAAFVSGAAGVALAGVGGVLVVPWDGSSAARPSSVAAAPHAATSSPSTAAVGEKEVIRTLEQLLPEGTFSNEDGRGAGQDPDTRPYASVVYDDGKGPAALSVSVDRVEPGGRQARELTQCPDRTFVPYDACATDRLPDGSAFMVLQGYEYPDRRVDTKLWTANLVTPGGRSVSVREWNAAAEKGAPVSRAEPPLSPAQLKHLTTAQEWRRIADAIPDSPRKGAEQPSAPTGGTAADTLSSLLPKGVEVVKKSGGDDPEYAYVVVDDGQGRSLVQVNVQPDMRDVADDLFHPGDESLADGTRIAVQQGPDEKGVDGVLMWTVDTMRADGKRVVITAFNSATQHSAATRSTPALTMQQMREMALSPKWWQGA
ncbi:hypothetical protein [Streptomyces noursei]|uniref:LigA protein n=1 Tax=Streptomyces noursei TaxID=1971 RepID=A0A2N8P7U8_STRNR|nr:hypothetical protein [Streptomyces noursei]PNE37101.1 hypothetical protein AOB60_22095 [Streptomyces noursei]